MNTGRMRYRIELQEHTVTTDDDGFAEESWNTVKKVWADITPVSAKEYMAANKENETVSSKVYIRYCSGITSDMRIKCGERILEIESVLGDRRNGMLVIMVSEAV